MKIQILKTCWFTAITGVISLLALPSPAQNLLVNGDFENEPNWGNSQVYFDGDATALTGSELPGWTIEPNHATTIHTPGAPYFYLTISGNYSLNTDGEGYMSNNADLYQDFSSQLGTPYALTFNWQTWSIAHPTNSQLEVSLVDDVTSTLLFDGLYSHDPGGPFPVHTVITNFVGTGNALRLRIQQTPESGYNDNMFVVDNFSVTAVTNVGALQVNINPPDAVNAGAQWQVDGGAFQASGAVVTNLNVGPHTIAFNSVSGYATPGYQVVQVGLGTTNIVNATYQAGTGALQVTINPAGAVSAGAQWQVDGGVWQTNGAVVTSLPVGNYTVAFSTIPGWVTPASQIISVNVSATNIISGTYSQTAYTWDQQALGQLYLQCQYQSHYWPNNVNWTQAYATNSNCNGTAIVESAPSNWDPTPPLGLYPGGPGLQGVNVIIGGLVNGTNIAGGANTYLQGSATVNNLTLQTNGSLNLGYITTLTASNVDIQGDTIIGAGQYAGGLHVAAGGSLTKSGGTNTLGFGVDGYGNAVSFQAVNAGLVVKSGTFAMPYNGAGSWLDGTFSVSNNATVLLNATNNSGATLGGNITGIGGGTVVMTYSVNAGGTDFYGTNHPGLTLDFPGNMFQWFGGALRGGPVTNNGVLNLTNAPGLQAALYNQGTMNLADNTSFVLNGGGGNSVYNKASGIVNIEGNCSITGNSILNFGLILKSAGVGTAQISPFFNNYGGTVEVDAGTMTLNGIYITNATFVVSNGATLDLATVGGNFEIEGTLSGSGGGTVLMNNGTVFAYYPTTLNFPGSMFQWAGGKLGGSGGLINNMTNLGTLNVSGPVGIDSYLANSGMMIQSGAGSFGSGNYLYNNAGAVYDIQNDNGIALNTIYNYGLLKKSAGTGTSLVSANFINYGANATVEVDTGTLALANPGGNYFTNTALVVSNGATLDLNTANVLSDFTDFEGYVNGSGGGTLLMTNGGVYCNSGAVMNFPGAMFQWLGGQIGNTATSSPLLTNSGTLNIGGPVRINGYLANSGTMIQTGSGAIAGGSGLKNTGVYEFQNDNGIALNTYFNNYGLLAKTSGTGASTIAAPFNNYGAIQAASGAFLFAGVFNQDAGTLQLNPGITFGSGQNFNLNGGTVTGVGALGYTGSYPVNINGGVLAPGNPFGALQIVPNAGIILYSGAVLNFVLGGPSQFSQLAVNKYIQYGGTLNVTLTNGYTPAIGTKFQIITNGSSGYSFATINVPHGISLTVSNTGVYLIVTSAVPAQVVSPQVSGGNFGFSFGTVNGQSYTVQQNTNLVNPNWTYYTNITGNGSLYQFLTPTTNFPQLFFRVREP